MEESLGRNGSHRYGYLLAKHLAHTPPQNNHALHQLLTLAIYARGVDPCLWRLLLQNGRFSPVLFTVGCDGSRLGGTGQE